MFFFMSKFELLGKNPNKHETARATKGGRWPKFPVTLCVWFLCISFEFPIRTLGGGASVREKHMQNLAKPNEQQKSNTYG